MKANVFSPACRLAALAGVVLVAGAQSAHAAFHLWNIREVYTDASGTRQFIEFFTASGSQQFVGGQQVRVSNVGGTETHTFTIPNNLPANSANHAFLIATAGAGTSGSPTPDYTIPNNFLFSAGGTITFFGANGGAYTSLPTDGVLSRTWGSGNAANTPQNFAGSVGSITIPSSPPAISITNPPNNSLFAAPATVSISVAASDSDGSVANVRLLTNGVPAATNTVPPYGFTLANLAAGNYVLTARAEDDASLSTTSAPVTVRVADRPALVTSPGIGGPVQFQFNSRTGVDYVIERATSLTNFIPAVTNPGNGGTLQFQETDGSAGQRNYRVRLQ